MCVYACVYVSIYVCMHELCMYLYSYVYVSTLSVYVCMNVYIYVCVRVYVNKFISQCALAFEMCSRVTSSEHLFKVCVPDCGK